MGSLIDRWLGNPEPPPLYGSDEAKRARGEKIARQASAKRRKQSGGSGYNPSAHDEPIRDTTPPVSDDYYYDSNY